jgi:hypothetical protein
MGLLSSVVQRLGAESLARLEQRLVEYGKSNVLELFEVRKKGTGGKGGRMQAGVARGQDGAVHVSLLGRQRCGCASCN